MPKHSKGKPSMASRCLQSVCILAIGVIAFIMVSFAQGTGLNFPMFEYIGWEVLILCVFVALGLIAGVWKPYTPSHWDDPYPMSTL